MDRWRPTASQVKAAERACPRGLWPSTREECRQEALLALWLAGEAGTDARMWRVARIAAVNYVRGSIGRSGARRIGLHVEWDENTDPRATLDTPEQWVSLWQTLAGLSAWQRAQITAAAPGVNLL